MIQKQKKPTVEITPDELSLWRRQVALGTEIMERYAEEAENGRALYQRFQAFDRRQKKTLDEIAERIERIERLLLLEKTGFGQQAEAREIRSEIGQELTSLQWQVSKHIKNLNYLEEQAAGYGSRIPLDIINQISDEQEIIQDLQLRISRAKTTEPSGPTGAQ